MKDEKVGFKVYLFGFLLIALTLYMCLTFTPVEREVNSYYQVFLGSEKVGLIKSDKELYKLIDKDQIEIRNK